ncbi:hypothetical protein ACFOON_05850 [Novosphingobium piscinae]|uniref:YozE SAM-like domain-containing protein n=1 Tax=Novosphingobium piscinae TaxID=1507448 RepID=A0A7X1G0C9_9SPHN|nr:hypothetical protein [Novosphingobium piscinae]MBC2669652.1 hypothetical protein [Novosphingobium piscinae]
MGSNPAGRTTFSAVSMQLGGRIYTRPAQLKSPYNHAALEDGRLLHFAIWGAMTFKEYLSQRRSTHTPQGDFVRDALSDKDLPNVTSWAELRAYLTRKSKMRGNDDLLDAAHSVWAAYRAKLARA